MGSIVARICNAWEWLQSDACLVAYLKLLGDLTPASGG